MENWETGANLLKTHHFEFPSRIWSFMAARVTGAPALSRGTGAKLSPSTDASTLCRHEQLVPVTRRYQPKPAALEELVDVLYILLVDVPVIGPATAPAPPKPTCFSTASE
jgi:hypothetical protein